MGTKSEFKAAFKKRPTKKAAVASHLIVQAGAGTGKTTTMIEGVKSKLFGLKPAIKPSEPQAAIWEEIAKSKGARTITMTSFGRGITKELKERVPEGVTACTINSLGNKSVWRAFGRVAVERDFSDQLIADAWGVDLWDARKNNGEVLKQIKALVDLCRQNLVTNDESLEEVLDMLCGHYDIQLNGNREEVYRWIPEIMSAHLNVEETRTIDFIDQVWLPIVLDLAIDRNDLLIVDEQQDTNRCQQELIIRAGDRLILVGDVNQAIYGFAGADAEAMEHVQARLEDSERGCTVLPLMETRRCGKAIVAEAQKIVPGFTAHKDNHEGSVSTGIYDGKSADCYLNSVRDGDRLICRVNAPLVSQAMRLLKSGRRAEIEGREVGTSLVRTIKKMKADDVHDLIEKLGIWIYQEQTKENRKRFPNDAKLIALQDRHDCILAFCEDIPCTTAKEKAASVDAVISRIASIFADQSQAAIRLSTIHKAKGLEAKRVYFLEPEGASCPHPLAKTDWQRKQEMNLRYVALTRAIEELVYVR